MLSFCHITCKEETKSEDKGDIISDDDEVGSREVPGIIRSGNFIILSFGWHRTDY